MLEVPLGGRLLVGAGQAEIEDLDLQINAKHDVGRLEVAVDDALVVGCFEPHGDLTPDLQGVADRQRARLDALGEVLALGQFHDQAVPAFGGLETVDAGDIRVLQLREGAGFAFEPRESFRILGERGGQDFHGHVPAQLGVVGAVNLAHPSGADAIDDGIVGDAAARLHGISRLGVNSGAENPVIDR